MITLLALLAVAYIVLKVLNTRAEFARRDAINEAERRAAEAEAEAEAEEALEAEEVRRTAVDVEAETIEDAVEFDVEETDEADEIGEPLPSMEEFAEAAEDRVPEEVNA